MRRKLCGLLSLVLIAGSILMVQPVTVEAATVGVMGDVDGSGSADAIDALAILKSMYIMGPGLDVSAGDVNLDGEADALDALEVLKSVAGMAQLQTRVELDVDEEFVVNGIYDKGSYLWSYEVSTETGVTVEREYLPIPPEYSDRLGYTPEQEYTITAKEPGRYTVTLKYTPVGDRDNVREFKAFVIDVK